MNGERSQQIASTFVYTSPNLLRFGGITPFPHLGGFCFYVTLISNMANYTSQAQIEARLGRTLTASEVTYLTTLLPAIDAFINTQTGTTFLPPSPDNDVTIYETPLENSNMLVIPTMRAVTSVAVSHGFTDDFVAVPGTEWRVYPRTGAILALQKQSNWGDEDTTVRIVGKLGYLTVPYDIAQVAGDMGVSAIVASSVNTTNSGNLKSERVGDWQVTYADASTTANSASGIASISSASMDILHGYNRLSRSI